MHVYMEPNESKTPTLAKLMIDQTGDLFWYQAPKQVGLSGAGLLFNRDGINTRIASIQEEIPKHESGSMQERILFLQKHPPSEDHSVQQRMYEVIPRDYYWLTMEQDVYNTVCDCHRCARNG